MAEMGWGNETIPAMENMTLAVSVSTFNLCTHQNSPKMVKGKRNQVV